MAKVQIIFEKVFIFINNNSIFYKQINVYQINCFIIPKIANKTLNRLKKIQKKIAQSITLRAIGQNWLKKND